MTAGSIKPMPLHVQAYTYTIWTKVKTDAKSGEQAIWGLVGKLNNASGLKSADEGPFGLKVQKHIPNWKYIFYGIVCHGKCVICHLSLCI